MPDDLIVLRPQGLYCPAGDFYIDPWRKVDRAVITHAHADHARSGHGHYLATAVSAGLLRSRLGAGISLQGVGYGEVIEHHGVRVSLHPAGHVLGSAQVRVEHRGQVWVASGDYYLRGDAPAEANPTCAAFEPVRCDCFITESTFGLPIYRWQAPAEVFADIVAWWRDNADAGRPSLLQGYSLGKAQHLLAGIGAELGADLAAAPGPIVVHSTVDAINHVYRAAGVALPETRLLDTASTAGELARALVIAPPTARNGMHSEALAHGRTAFASGWMQVRSARKRPGLDRGFVLSDHADWPGLTRAIAATGCERVIVTHGQEAALARWLREHGLQAGRFQTEYGQGDSPDSSQDAQQGDAFAPPAPSDTPYQPDLLPWQPGSCSNP